jgi:uncharacterized linocin/CFP29 family protein
MSDTPMTQDRHPQHHDDHAARHQDQHAPPGHGPMPHPGGHAHADGAHGGAHGDAQNGGATARASGGAKHGRDKIDWGPEVWKRIDAAVKHEITRARVCAKFLPTVHVPAKQTTVLADIVTPTSNEIAASTPAFNIDESASIRINEFWVEFALTPAQVEEAAEGHHSHGAGAAITLATRAANVLAQVEDSILLQGANALSSALFSAASPVNYRKTGVPLDFGLLAIGTPQAGSLVPQQTQIVQVQPVTANGPYQSTTVAAVAQAFSMLQAAGQYGPYALVLQTTPFADVNSPLPTTLITPAEPIRHLMDAGLYGAGTMPPFIGAAGANGLPTTPAGVRFTGVCVSIGGEVVDLVRGHMQDDEDVVVRFEQKDVDGNYRFRVVERFALRIKDITGIVQLLFM